MQNLCRLLQHGLTAIVMMYSLYALRILTKSHLKVLALTLLITYSPIPRTVTIIVGDTAVIPKDSKGQPLQFNTIISVLNWLSKKGWHVEPIDMNSNTQQSYSFLLSRDNTTDKELGSMFN